MSSAKGVLTLNGGNEDLRARKEGKKEMREKETGLLDVP